LPFQGVEVVCTVAKKKRKLLAQYLQANCLVTSEANIPGYCTC